jgi:ABC-type lipoprotein export system ATPase subunit
VNAIFELDAVRRVYRQRRVEVQALAGVSLTIDKGEMVAVTGPSGSGKSTLLHVMGALDHPSSGSLTILGEQVASYSDDRLAAFRRRQLGFVFQFFNLLPTLSARENAALPLLLDGVARREAYARADGLLDRVGLGDRAGHRPDELSGGQQQRVALARALVAKPAVLLADEPTGNLDSSAGAEVLDLLAELRAESELTLVLVTHDDRVAKRAERRVRLVDGRVDEDLRLTVESEEPA